jgi:hypothetical protein
MPSENWRRTAGFDMLGMLGNIAGPVPNPPILSPLSVEAIGDTLVATTGVSFVSGTYPAANRALAYGITLARPYLVRKVWWGNGTTATTDSADVGVYTETGTRLVSGGGTAISGASNLQEVDVTDTLLQPGRYYLAYSQSGVTATPLLCAATAALARACGIVQMATAYPLPSTLTPAAVAGTGLPLFGIAARTQVA